MDPYTVCLLIGGVGIGAMALGGAALHGHAGAGLHGHGAGGGHGHFLGGHAHGASAGHGAGAAHGAAGPHQVGSAALRTFWGIVSPRVLFSFMLGMGTSGLLLRPVLAGVLLFVAAAAGGVLFERVVVTPVWNLALRFASSPALTLESAVSDEATVVSAFDANGQGIIEVELDGQAVRVLGTLQEPDREAGVRPRSGDRVRIEAVDADRNRCTVSAL